MAQGNRPVRVGEAIREVLAEKVMRGLKTPGVGFCTITGVEVTKDLRDAKVYVSVYGPPAEQQATLAALTRAGGYLRGEVGREVRMKFAPNLVFILDHSVERGANMDAAIKKARQADQDLARLRGDPPTPPAPATAGQPGTEAPHANAAPITSGADGAGTRPRG
jgi:ribosome-binding factor A